MVCASVYVCVNAGDTHRMSTSVSCVGYVCACVCVRGDGECVFEAYLCVCVCVHTVLGVRLCRAYVVYCMGRVYMSRLCVCGHDTHVCYMCG